MTAHPREILDFWFGETPPERWFAVDPAFDAEIGRRFQRRWEEARDGVLDGWSAGPDGALALILLCDQFPRNMFRGRAEAFATDSKARFFAVLSVDNGYDLVTRADRRQFFYLPFMHSESVADQERSVSLIRERLGAAHASYAFALRHRDAILRFGRFPARNAALGRQSTAAETEFLAAHPAGF